MSTEIFSFLRVEPWRYGPFEETDVMEGNGVRVTRPLHGPYGLYRAGFVVRVPGNSKTVHDWATFIRTIRGGWDTFLFKEPLLTSWYLSTLEALGTGNASATDFALDFRYVDASTLRVFKDAVEATTGWSLVDNNTTPKVRFTSAPGSGVVVTATYEYYIPVRFVSDPSPGTFLGAGSNFSSDVEVIEDYSGAHRV